MESTLKEKLELLVENYSKINRAFFFSRKASKGAAALFYTMKNMPVNIEAISGCRRLIRQKAPFFSQYKRYLCLGASALLSFSPDPAQHFTDALTVYNYMKAGRFRMEFGDAAVAALEIAAYRPKNLPEILARTQTFYNGEKRRSPGSRGGASYCFSALVALSKVDAGIGVQIVDELYEPLEKGFSWCLFAHNLAQILALSGEGPSAAIRVLALGRFFRERDNTLQEYSFFNSLCVLALAPMDPALLWEDFSDAQSFLLSQRKSGLSTASHSLLILLISVIVACHCQEKDSGLVDPLLSTVAIAIVLSEMHTLTYSNSR
jgi:hypothetical protein